MKFPGSVRPAGLAGLTRRERQVAEAAAQGLCHKDVAARLNLSPGTVKVYLSHIYDKLEIENQASLIRRWILEVEMPDRGDCPSCVLRQAMLGGPELVTID